MESNISRDHIALEAMKCMMNTAKRRRSLFPVSLKSQT